MNDTFLREVDEDYRLHRLQRLWRDFGSYIIAGGVALVLAIGGSAAWTGYQRDQHRAATSALLAALEPAPNRAALEQIVAEKGPLSGVAALHLAALAPERRTEWLTPLAAEANLWGALASVSLEAPAAGQNIHSGANTTAAALFPLAVKEQEVLSAWKAGNIDQARAAIEALRAAPFAASGLATRAELWNGLLANAANNAAPASGVASDANPPVSKAE